MAELAHRHNIIDGVVHDKLYLPGLVKLRRLVDMGFFGRILSKREEKKEEKGEKEEVEMSKRVKKQRKSKKKEKNKLKEKQLIEKKRVREKKK